MKKMISFILLISIFLSFLPLYKVSAATINKTTASIYISDSFNLSVSGSDKYILWKSSNSSVASVSKTGTVIGKKVGAITISATVGSGKSAQKLKCSVSVKSRLSSNDQNIVIQADEYQELAINWKGAKKGEVLVSADGDTAIAYSEWPDNNKEYILRIIPEDLGYTKTVIGISNLKGYDPVKYLDYLSFNVFVVQDSEWIPEYLIEQYNGKGLLDYVTDSFEFDTNTADIDQVVEDDSDTISILNYKGKTIRYKIQNDYEILYNVEDLRAAGII
jgi:hypothetical protein